MNRIASILLMVLLLASVDRLYAQSSGPAAPASQPVTGQLLDPQGKPLADTYVRVVARQLDVYDAKFTPAPIRGDLILWDKTDAQGRFSFPPQDEPNYSLVVATDEGYVIEKGNKLKLPAQVQLQRWGRLEGILTMGDNPPPAGTPVRAQAHDFMSESNGPIISYSTTTDSAGHFVVERMFALTYSVTRGPRDGVKILPGETTKIAVGSKYRPVAGRIQYPEGFDPASWHLEALDLSQDTSLPQLALPADILRMNPPQRLAWFNDWLKSPAGQAHAAAWEHAKQLNGLRPQFSRTVIGRFQINDLPPGDYNLTVNYFGIKDKKIDSENRLTAKLYDLKIPKMPYEAAAFDVGRLSGRQDGMLNVGQPMQDVVIPTLDGKEMLLSSFKGKVILLDFWGVWCGACAYDLPHLQAIYDRYGKDPNFVMVSLSVDDTPERVREHLQKTRMPWTIGVLGPRDEAWATQLYSVTGYPTYWLIGADGKVAANGNFTEFLSPIVEKALDAAKVKGD